MAKKTKRKLNPNVVIALSVAGVVLLVLVGVGLYIKRDRIWPMSPAASTKLGDEALQKGNFQDAVKNYKDAVGNSKGRDKSDRLIKLSEIAYQWLAATPNDQSAQKRERYDLFRAALSAAKRETPAYIEPRKRLVEHWFSVVVTQPPANRPYNDCIAAGLSAPCDPRPTYRPSAKRRWAISARRWS
ncbi:MAG: hypothetical protein NT031_02290 [Planctomycetota bacterium]|nr:hypothetical protein [Planctomycetota bacterium]